MPGGRDLKPRAARHRITLTDDEPDTKVPERTRKDCPRGRHKHPGHPRLRAEEESIPRSGTVEQHGHSGNAKAEIAERHGLRVARGKIPMPDLRIEYETTDRNMLASTSNSQQTLPLQKHRPEGPRRLLHLRPRSGRLEPATRPGPARTHCGDFEPMNIPQNQVALLMELGYTEPKADFSMSWQPIQATSFSVSL
jgi:hypothetical protein